ncbi:MAG TPA: hypothetical protein VK949_05690 [Methylotenera sp.]|nr:hypothetical protein [Methylotenera sp.]
MSKINPIQAAALSGSKPIPTNTSTVKATEKKKEPVKTSSPTAKAAIKPAVKSAVTPVAKAKTTTAAKPVAAKNAEKTAAKPATAKNVAKPAKPAKEKTPKLRMERDSFTMPKVEYAQLYVLKERLIKLGQASKKSELLRAGIMQLTAMTDAALKAAMAKVPAIKTGRPKKK